MIKINAAHWVATLAKAVKRAGKALKTVTEKTKFKREALRRFHKRAKSRQASAETGFTAPSGRNSRATLQPAPVKARKSRRELIIFGAAAAALVAGGFWTGLLRGPNRSEIGEKSGYLDNTPPSNFVDATPEIVHFGKTITFKDAATKWQKTTIDQIAQITGPVPLPDTFVALLKQKADPDTMVLFHVTDQVALFCMGGKPMVLMADPFYPSKPDYVPNLQNLGGGVYLFAAADANSMFKGFYADITFNYRNYKQIHGGGKILEGYQSEVCKPLLPTHTGYIQTIQPGSKIDHG